MLRLMIWQFFYGNFRQSEHLSEINLTLRLLSMVKITYLMITKTEFQICLWALETLRIMIIKMVLSTWGIEIFQVKIWSKSKTINFLSAKGVVHKRRWRDFNQSQQPTPLECILVDIFPANYLPFLTRLSLVFVWPPTYLSCPCSF